MLMKKTCNLRYQLMASLAFAAIACTNRNAEPRDTVKTKEPVRIDVWASEKTAAGRLNLLLREGKYRAEILQVVGPARLGILGNKMKEAARTNPGPWLGQLLQSKPGEPLPYDPKFGVTEAEYKEFLSLAGKFEHRKTGEADLVITATPEGVYSIKGLPDVPEMTVDGAKMTVKVAQGSVSDPTEVTANENQKLTGPFNCYSWRTGVLGLLGGNNIRVFVGQLVQSKQVLIELRIRDATQDRYVVDYLVRFPGPKK